MAKPTKQTVLIVDDDEQFRLSLSKIFAKVGYKVNTAADAKEALHLLDKSFQSLIITDQRLPGMSGLQLLSEIKLSSPKSKVLVITAFGDESLREKAIQFGAFALLDKPVKRQEILKWAFKALEE